MKPNIENSKLSHPFIVHEKYFDKMYAEILDKKSESKFRTGFSWNTKLSISIATLAACIAIVVVIYLPNQSKGQDWLSEVNNEEIIYFLNQYEGWTIEEIAQLTPESELLESAILPIYTDDFDLNENLIDELFIEYETEITLPEI